MTKTTSTIFSPHTSHTLVTAPPKKKNDIHRMTINKNDTNGSTNLDYMLPSYLAVTHVGGCKHR